MEGKKSFVLYADLINVVKKLPMEKQAELFMVILEYVNDMNPDPEDIIIQIAFEPVRLQLKRDLQKWGEIKEQRSKAGKLGGRPPSTEKAKKANALSDKQKKQDEAKKAVNVNVNVNDTVNGITNVNGNTNKQKEEIQDNLFVAVVENKRWIETMAMNHKTDIDLVKGHLRTFYFHCIAYDHWKTTESKVMQHFNNWVVKGNPIPQPKINSNFEGW